MTHVTAMPTSPGTPWPPAEMPRCDKDDPPPAHAADGLPLPQRQGWPGDRPTEDALSLGEFSRLHADRRAAQPSTHAPQQPPAPSVLGALGDAGFHADVVRGLGDVAGRSMAAVAGGLVDLANLGVNIVTTAGGFLGHQSGLLRPDQLPALETQPIGGSAWIGAQMQRAGLISAERRPLAEMLGTALLAPAGARIASGGAQVTTRLAASAAYQWEHRVVLDATRFAQREVTRLGPQAAVDGAYAGLRATAHASAGTQLRAEARAMAVADRAGLLPAKGDMLEIHAFRHAQRHGEIVLTTGQRRQMLEQAQPGVSLRSGFDLPTLRPRGDGRHQLVIGEMKNYSGEAAGFSAVTRNLETNLSKLEKLVRANAFTLSPQTQFELLRSIQNRHFTVEVYGNRATRLNQQRLHDDVLDALIPQSTDFQLSFRRVPW